MVVALPLRRNRLTFIFIPIFLFILLFIFLSLNNDTRETVLDRSKILRPASGPPEKGKGPPPLPRHPIYKDPAKYESRRSNVTDNFPLAETARSPADLPPVPSWNKPPSTHVKEKTPLFIGFTRNWRLVQQAIVSYVTAGWPPEDIYLVENTGTMSANKNGNLSLQNPFYLNYTRLTTVLGINVLSTPTLLSFAQLQNFYLNTAIQNDWPTYFWGHMDVGALCDEEYGPPYKSLYMRAVDKLRETQQPSYLLNTQTGRNDPWAIQFFAYDRLALVNRETFEAVGGWDTMIGYYGTDCDMHERLTMAGFKMPVADAGFIFDLGTTLDDLYLLYRRQPATAEEDGPPKYEGGRSIAPPPPAEKSEGERTERGEVRSSEEEVQDDDTLLSRSPSP